MSEFQRTDRGSLSTTVFTIRKSLVVKLVAIAVIAASLVPASALAAPSVISNTNVAEVGENGATLKASVDPAGANVEARFDYTTRTAFQNSGFEGSQSVPVGEAILVPSKVKGNGDLEAGKATITDVSTEAGTFAAGQAIAAGLGIPAGTMILKVEAEEGGGLTLTISKPANESKAGVALTATGPQPVSARLEGLIPGTAYVFRAAARKTSGANKEEGQGPATTFSTVAAPPVFGPCPNDEFRSGQFAPAGHLGSLLPDCRSFELASPLAKNGNDLQAELGYALVAEDGSAITFGATFGVPKGNGAQLPPFYQASRGEGDSGWSTTSVMPPGSFGSEVRILIGKLPDLSATYAVANRLGTHPTGTLLELHRDGSPPTQIVPYVDVEGLDPNTEFDFAGASEDATSVLVESTAALPAEAGGPPLAGSAAGSPNVYAWDRSSGHLHLASVMNTEEETQEALAKGAFAGPYNWADEDLSAGGGAGGNYYLTDGHAVTPDGSVYFTARSSGKLYERLHPTQPQSAVIHSGEPDEECTEPEMACTITVSASHRSEPDPAGEEPAAFQSATADGSQVLFTSHEKLTDDANTGPEAAKAAIGRATLHGEEPADGENDQFLPTHALGVAVDSKGEFIYWADPSKGTIARAELDASGDLVPGSTEAEYVVPGETEAEVHQVSEPGVKTKAPTKPRYVAVGPCAEGGECVYWTNAGPAGEKVNREEAPTIDGQGTIGRATIGPGQGEDPDPEFITGASNPQGIAVNETNIYWANAAPDKDHHTIAQATIDGGGVNEVFAQPFAELKPYAVALDSTHIYFSIDDEEGTASYIGRVNLDGTESETRFIGESGVRGVGLGAGHLYWATQGEGGAIGHVSLNEWGAGLTCESIPSCHKEFLTPSGRLEGIANTGSHLYWSSNGEAPKNPGNDLYRFTRTGAGGCQEARGCLEDLTPDGSVEDGADVRGVLGTSADDSYIYFAANADLDGSGDAQPGNCAGEFGPTPVGECSIYLLHEGQISFVARVGPLNLGGLSDSVNWAPSARQGGGFTGSRIRFSLVAPDGKTLIFYLGGQLHRFRVGGQAPICITCDPTGGGPQSQVRYGSMAFPFINPGASLGTYRLNFATRDGDRVFFESTAALVGSDRDGEDGCPNIGFYSDTAPRCLDVYEWEAVGSGSCREGGPGYSPLDDGCLYLISQGSDSEPAFFANASPSGDDVFFFTRSRLVGEDTDGLRDVYDARVGGGLASQNQPPPPPPCEGEGCKPAASEPPSYQAPPQFSGPSNPKPPRCHRKRCHKHNKHKPRHAKKRRHGRKRAAK